MLLLYSLLFINQFARNAASEQANTIVQSADIGKLWQRDAAERKAELHVQVQAQVLRKESQWGAEAQPDGKLKHHYRRGGLQVRYFLLDII